MQLELAALEEGEHIMYPRKTLKKTKQNYEHNGGDYFTPELKNSLTRGRWHAQTFDKMDSAPSASFYVLSSYPWVKWIICDVQ